MGIARSNEVTSHITLLTDFGTDDTCVGQMKGVIAGIAPEAAVIDLTHAVPPQDVRSGAVALDSAVDDFPAGTIHVAVIDPDVGSARRGVAVETERFTLFGPDNGLFGLVLSRHPMGRAVTP
jgi:S-adenosylmethionine hydrolase